MAVSEHGDLPQRAAGDSCAWSQDDVGGDSVWETQCKHVFYFDGADGPKDCGFAWCPYCGKSLDEQRTSDDAETDAESQRSENQPPELPAPATSSAPVTKKEEEESSRVDLSALRRNTTCAICGHRFDRHITEPDIEINYLTCADCELCPGFAIASQVCQRVIDLEAQRNELLTALKDLNEEARREGHDDCDDWNWQEYIRAADAAINKAEGR